MFFLDIASVQKRDRQVCLFNKKGKPSGEMELGRHPLRFESMDDLIIASSLEGDLFGQKPISEAYLRTAVSGTLKPINLNLNSFTQDRFLGPVEKATLFCLSGDEHHTMGRIWTPDKSIDDVLSLHISVVLPANIFKEIFHPIWIRQTRAQLDVTINVIGYQMGIEAAFGEIGDIENILVEAETDIDSKLASLRLVNRIGANPSPK